MSFPNIGDKLFLSEISKKSEISKYRERDKLQKITKFHPKSYQALIRNYLNPLTPYQNVLMFWGTGTGKTVGSLLISEEYAKRIQILHKSNSISETVNGFSKGMIYIITKTGQSMHQFIETLIKPEISHFNYIRKEEYDEYIKLKTIFENDPSDKNYETYRIFYKYIREVILSPSNNCYYRFIKYASFRNILKQITEEKLDLSDSLFIFDEAHEIEGNKAEDVLFKIKQDSQNIRIILITATPMMTNPSETIRILNMLKPIEEQLNENDFFVKENVINKTIIPTLGKLSQGYVSSVEVNKQLFPELIEEGKKLQQLKYIKLISCPATIIQEKLFEKKISKIIKSQNEEFDPKLFTVQGQRSLIHTDLVIPISYQKKGKKINRHVFYNKDNFYKYYRSSKLDVEQVGQNKVLGKSSILRLFDETNKGLRKISGKYSKLIETLLSRMKKNSGKILITHRSIVEGILLISSILDSNGFSRFPMKRVDGESICYRCGKRLKEHNTKEHEFHPASYLPYYSKTTQLERKRLVNIFNSKENIEGKFIKIIIGSSIVRESIDFNALREIHNMVAQESLNMDRQIIGRGVRLRSHHMLPKSQRTVRIFRYATIFDLAEKKYKILSPDKYIYFYQEDRFILIRKIEKVFRENAFDCNMNAYLNIVGNKRLMSRSKNKCKMPPLKAYNKLDTSTDRFIDGSFLLSENKKLIKYIFSFTPSLSFSQIIKEVMKLWTELGGGQVPFISDTDILYAMHDIIISKEVISNIYGIIGKLNYLNKCVAFIPDKSVSEKLVSNIFPKKSNNQFDITEELENIKQSINNQNIGEEIENIRRRYAAIKKMNDSEKNNLNIKFENEFNLFPIDSRVKIIETFIQNNEQKLLHVFPNRIRKYLISDAKISSQNKIFHIKTKGTEIFGKKGITYKETDYFGHIMTGKLKCFDRKSKTWQKNCFKLLGYIVDTNFVLDDYVGFDEIDPTGHIIFKIWINEGIRLSDKRKRKKGKNCKSFLSETIIDELFKFVGTIPEKTMIEHKDILCKTLRGKFIEKNRSQRKKENGKTCYLTALDRLLISKKNIIDF